MTSYLLLVFCPIGWISCYLGLSSIWVFWLNFAALLPLANLLGDLTEEVADGLHSQVLGGLLNASFGNAVEMILTWKSVSHGLVDVAKNSLLGSILSNLLLVLGTSFFFGGIGVKGKEQVFNETGPITSTSMLLLGCMAFAIPSCFEYTNLASNLLLSRMTAVALLVAYGAFVYFQTYTHIAVFEDNESEESLSPNQATISDVNTELLVSPLSGRVHARHSAAHIPLKCSLVKLFITTLLVSLNSECLIGSITGLVSQSGLSSAFIGVVLLPVVGNACEHVSAVRMCIRDRPALAIAIAVGSSTQIALFVLPLSVVLAWLNDVPMDLDLGVMNTVMLVLSVIIVFSIVVDGKVNWLEGLLLQVVYFVLAVAFWLLPEKVIIV